MARVRVALRKPRDGLSDARRAVFSAAEIEQLVPDGWVLLRDALSWPSGTSTLRATGTCGSHFHYRLTSREQWLVTLQRFWDAGPGDGGTPMLRCLYREVARIHAPAGRAGDGAMQHPFVVHGFGPNRGTRVRFACIRTGRRARDRLPGHRLHREGEMAVRFVAAAVAVLASMSLALQADATAAFQGLGILPGGFAYSEAEAISADGRVVVGISAGRAYRWTFDTGMQPVHASGTGYGASADGSVIVGAGSPGGAFRWTESTGAVELGSLPGGVTPTAAWDVSGDGSVVVGQLSSFGAPAFRWTESGGLQNIEGDAYGLSQDGQVAVGIAPVGAFGVWGTWTEAEGWQPLPVLPGLHETSRAWATSANGSVVVGSSPNLVTNSFGTFASPYDAALWSEETGTISLGEPAGSARVVSEALSVSADGRVVVGFINTAAFGSNRAFLWDAEHGMRFLHDVLADLGIDLGGWLLLEATDISADGLSIIGNGINPQGGDEAWIVILPEPSTGALLAGGLALLARRRRA